MNPAVKIFKGLVSFAGFVGVLLAMLIIGASMLDDCSGNSLGKAQKQEDLLVFYKSVPCAKYEDLGTVKVGLTATNKASDCLDALIKKAKKNYPTGEAIIISDPDLGSAAVVKFLQDE